LDGAKQAKDWKNLGQVRIKADSYRLTFHENFMSTVVPTAIPYGRQLIDDEDIAAVVAVLRSDFLTQGPAVGQFEQAVAQYCKVPFAVAVNSATSALHIACLALGVGSGDTVWTSPITFVASANCARYCGASVDFVDIDPESFNMCPRRLETKLATAKTSGRLPKVIVAVHMTGQPCEMAQIKRLADEYGVAVVEDASHAIGARLGETMTGDCAYSDITVFSFHPVKIVTTAEGGMATTRDPVLARRLQLFRSHGITREQTELEDANVGGWHYEQHCLGLNYRLTDVQAALGVSQMRRIDQWIDRRNQLAMQYDAKLAHLPLLLPKRPSHIRHALHLYVVRIDTTRTAHTRREVFDRLRAAGIGVNVHYIPVHTQPDYKRLGFKLGDFPLSEQYYAQCISIPMFAGLTDTAQDAVCAALEYALK
jgi:UDP-4-amino-4,6-dideoxy-N-acetyl-beta-L-altrosamine transaminase